MSIGYVFERDFSADRSEADETPFDSSTPIYSESDLRAAEQTARAEGFEAGRSVGRSDAMEASEAIRAEERHDALLALAARIETLCADAGAHRAALEAQMTDFALVTCERVMPEILRTRSIDRAAAEVRRCLGLVMGSPRIRVFMSQRALDTHRAAIEDTIRDRHAGTSRWSLRPTRHLTKATRASNGTTASWITASARSRTSFLKRSARCGRCLLKPPKGGTLRMAEDTKTKTARRRLPCQLRLPKTR
jgi:flagellar assembly protein FliH